MNIQKIKDFIADGENLVTEFKLKFSSHHKIAKEIIAFANTKGGNIFFGVGDDGSIQGVESEKETAELIKETIENYCEPRISYSIKYIELFGYEIVQLEIPEAINKPIRIQDYKKVFDINSAEVFIRVNDKSLPASKELIKIMQANVSNIKLNKYSIGKTESLVFEYLKENDSISVKQLKKIANISTRRASRTLINLVRANLLYLNTQNNGNTIFTNLG